MNTLRRLLLCTAMIAAMPAELPASPPVLLRPAVVVRGEHVRLGDVFVNAGASAEAAIAAAPAAGSTLVLDARALQRLASGYGLDWQPLSADVRAVIERETVPLDETVLKRHVLAALAERGVDVRADDLDLLGPLPDVKVPVNAAVTIERLSYQPPARRFAAVVGASVDGQVLRRVSLRGEIRQWATVPVATKPLRRGETIAAADIEWREVSEVKGVQQPILDDAAMIGLTVRRDVKPGAPILAGDLARPALVDKGALVTIVLTQPNMRLTARGKAMKQGGAGDVIPVINLQSQQVVEAVVTDIGTVSVGPSARAGR